MLSEKVTATGVLQQLGDRHRVQDLGHRLLQLVHRCFDRADGLAGATICARGTLGDRVIRFERIDDAGDRNLLRREHQGITAAHTLVGADHAVALQILHDLGEEIVGNVVLLGNLPDGRNRVTRHLPASSEMLKGHQAVFHAL